MKILLTGGGSGGHFYPIIAIADEINNITKENRLVRPEIFFMSNDPYNEGLLYENNITFVQAMSGKVRVKPSFTSIILNFFDFFKIVFGSIGALWSVFSIYPDVVFGKGGFSSFPALLAARILRIPVVIHESDSAPGRVNLWAGKFARKIALSYPDAASYFPKDKVAYTGNPIRKEVMEALSVGAHEYLKLDPSIPTILILGGSQGAQIINEVIMDALPRLVEQYQVIHQTGKNNIKVIQETSAVILQANSHKDRYRPYDYLNILTQRMSAGACDIIVSRAGSTIFEIASWAKPSILIPITNSNGDHQRKNAYSYARSGAAIVIEEKNLVANVLVAEINRIMGNKDEIEKMKASAQAFAKRDAARLIAEEIVKIALEHEK
ncbi:MAG: UDP-N-acetylglucosamine--N-acetylmuramyl-(pentapeptide) pyrophosphoryl-undecaprenol N-acetylglucosamine transferase [bacterium]